MKKYIPMLMEMYKEMQSQNDLHLYHKPYSHSMLHYIITLINKCNNK